MKTLDDLKQAIVDDLERPDLLMQAEREALSAIVFYEQEQFFFSEDAQISLAAENGKRDYTSGEVPDLPRITKIIDVTLEQNGSVKRLTRIPPKTPGLHQKGSGKPAYYSVVGNTIQLYPTPDDAYTLKIYGFKMLDDLTAGDQSNAWTTDAFDLIRARASASVCAFKLRDMEAATVYQKLEEQQLIKLRQMTETRRGTDMIRGAGT